MPLGTSGRAPDRRPSRLFQSGEARAVDQRVGRVERGRGVSVILATHPVPITVEAKIVGADNFDASGV
jgi:hypothetical protein